MRNGRSTPTIDTRSTTFGSGAGGGWATAAEDAPATKTIAPRHPVSIWRITTEHSDHLDTARALSGCVSKLDRRRLIDDQRLDELMRRARARDVDAHGEHATRAALQLHDVLRVRRNLRCFLVGPLGAHRGALTRRIVGKHHPLRRALSVHNWPFAGYGDGLFDTADTQLEVHLARALVIDQLSNHRSEARKHCSDSHLAGRQIRE